MRLRPGQVESLESLVTPINPSGPHPAKEPLTSPPGSTKTHDVHSSVPSRHVRHVISAPTHRLNRPLTFRHCPPTLLSSSARPAWEKCRLLHYNPRLIKQQRPSQVSAHRPCLPPHPVAVARNNNPHRRQAEILIMLPPRIALPPPQPQVPNAHPGNKAAATATATATATAQAAKQKSPPRPIRQ